MIDNSFLLQINKVSREPNNYFPQWNCHLTLHVRNKVANSHFFNKISKNLVFLLSPLFPSEGL